MIGRLLSPAATAAEALISAIPGLPPELSQAGVMRETDSRPWPPPREPWVMAQTWRDLLFAHWALPPKMVRAVLPARIPLDTFEGRAWIGITPFEVSGLRPRGAPPPPGGSRFPELNVRTYTTLDGKPGIYFLSLDAGSALAVHAARRAYRLPYFRAQMEIKRDGEALHYTSERPSSSSAPAGFAMTYRPSGPRFRAQEGSLEYFLTERYCLYTINEEGTPLRAEIQHPPWPLQHAEGSISRNTMTLPWGIELPSSPPLLHFARVQNVLIWPLRPAGSS